MKRSVLLKALNSFIGGHNTRIHSANGVNFRHKCYGLLNRIKQAKPSLVKSCDQKVRLTDEKKNSCSDGLQVGSCFSICKVCFQQLFAQDLIFWLLFYQEKSSIHHPFDQAKSETSFYH